MAAKKITVGTVFSGIGAPEQALYLEGWKTSIAFACDNGERVLPYTKSEIDEMLIKDGVKSNEINSYIKSLYRDAKKSNFVKKTYFANYRISEEKWFEDVRFLDGNQFKGKIDLFVGGSPCQSFSNMGKRKGLDDTRGTLFYEYARLIKEIGPKVFIYENVPGMLTHDHGNTWDTIKSVFGELGYKTYYKILNSCDYGIPQNRKRIFVVGFANKRVDFVFPDPIRLPKTVSDYLEESVDAKYYLGEKGFNFVTHSAGRAKLNESVMRTQKANQQFNWNGSFIFEKLDKRKHNGDILSRAYVGEWQGQIGVIRQLTPKECLRLMGFPDSFVIPVPDVHAYRQSGNSIVVDVLRAILRAIEKCGGLNE